jgi:hypothetical protein
LVTLSPYVWVRIVGALDPVLTLVVVLGTANHWILDAVGALATLALAYGLQYLLTGQHLAGAPPAAVLARERPPAASARTHRLLASRSDRAA